MKKLLVLSTLTLVLSACVSSGTQVVVDGQEYAMSRTAPERLEDFSIERMALQNISQIYGLEQGNHRVAVNAFRSDVLLTGEVPTQEIKEEIATVIKSIRQVGQVYNFLSVEDAKGQSYSFHEQYLKRKIDAKLLLKQNQNIKPSQYSVVVRDDIAYVMGVMTVAQQEEVIATTKSVDGLKGIVLLNSLVKVNLEGLTSTVQDLSEKAKDNTVNPNNRLAVTPTPAPVAQPTNTVTTAPNTGTATPNVPTSNAVTPNNTTATTANTNATNTTKTTSTQAQKTNIQPIRPNQAVTPNIIQSNDTVSNSVPMMTPVNNTTQKQTATYTQPSTPSSYVELYKDRVKP